MDDDGTATQNGPIEANDTTSASVELMLAELGPLDPTRTVLAATARRLASTLDRMDDETAARMAAQTGGALAKVVERLGLPQRPTTVAVAAPEREPPTSEVWHPGIEDDLYAEELAWRIQRYARRTGLPVPGRPAFAADPWAPDPFEAQGRRMRSGGAAERERPLGCATGRAADSA